MASITDKIVERIVERRKIYAAAYQADLDRAVREFGRDPVVAALQVIEQNGQRAADPWDAAGHARLVAKGVERTVAEHRQRGAEVEEISGVLPPAWR